MTHVEQQSACERLLDFAYGELDEAEAQKFRAHLEECGKCRAELASIERVRGAVKVALPALEPPASTSGALHAQLLHAAAQRRPAPRGKLLVFARKVMQHPAYAAAAMFLLVGGAVGIEWSRGRLLMPEHQLAQSVESAQPAEAKPATPEVPTPPKEAENRPTAASDPLVGSAPMQAAVPAAEPPVGGTAQSARGTEGGGYLEKATRKGDVAESDKKSSTRYYLGAQGNGLPMEVKPTPARHAAAHRASARYDRGGGDGLGGLPSMDDGRAQSAPFATAPAAAPAPPPAPSTRPSSVDGLMDSSEGKAEKTQLAQPRERREAKDANSAVAVPRAAVATKSPTPDSLRKRAVEAANANRCDEAVRLFDELERDHPRYHISARDRAGYVRCLRQSGREQQALDELNSIAPTTDHAAKNHAPPPAQRSAAPAEPQAASEAEPAQSKKKSGKKAAEPAKTSAPSY